MLGRFLEYSLATQDIRASFEFYSSLGFAALEVGETYAYPYAALSDGRICVGLHQAEIPSPALSFVRPELLKALDALEPLGIELETRRLGNDVFNEVLWRDPGGQLVRLIEARTYSPAKPDAGQRSLPGYFLEIALPAADVELAKQYWEALGFVGMDEAEPLPHLSLTSDTLDLALYEPAVLRRPALRFEVDDLEATRSALEGAGIKLAMQTPLGLAHGSALGFTAPEGTLLIVTTAA